MTCALSIYSEIILAALATLAVSMAALGAAYVAKELTNWRRWRK